MASAQEIFTQVGMEVVLVQLPYAISASVITPIVFCASFVPCASETREAEPTWPQRNVPSRRRSGIEAMIRKTSHVPTPATTPAMTGDAKAGTMIEVITPCQFTPASPSEAI